MARWRLFFLESKPLFLKNENKEEKTRGHVCANIFSLGKPPQTKKKIGENFSSKNFAYT